MKINMNKLSMRVIRTVFLLDPILIVKSCHRERVPSSGSALIAPSHKEYLDIPLITGTAFHREIRYMAKESLFDNKYFGKYLRATGTFPVKQDSPDRPALRTAADKLAAGEAVCIFLEGNRHPGSYTVQPIKPGFILAVNLSKTDCPIIPVGIDYRKLGKILFAYVYYGEPFKLSDCGSTNQEMIAETQARMQAAQDKAAHWAKD